MRSTLRQDSINDYSLQAKQIKVSLIIEIDKSEEVITQNFSIAKCLKTDDLIIKVINEFNILLTNKNYRIRFDYNYSNYQLRPSKKNDRPNMDLPNLDKEIYVFETGITNLSLIYSQSDLITLKNRSKCINCSIL